MAEYDAAQRPRDEADRECGVRAERAGERIEGWKEELVEDERGGGAVEEEVVPLDGGADEGSDDDPAKLD